MFIGIINECLLYVEEIHRKYKITRGMDILPEVEVRCINLTKKIWRLLVELDKEMEAINEERINRLNK